jgi:S1-C subfamily serine protease
MMSEWLTLLVLTSVGLAPVPAAPPPDPLGWGYLGVAPEPGSMRLQTVQAGTPAEKAGLRPGDWLIKVGSLKSLDWSEITDYICTCRPGTLIRVEVRRGEEMKVFTVRLGVRPADLGPPPLIRQLPPTDR